MVAAEFAGRLRLRARRPSAWGIAGPVLGLGIAPRLAVWHMATGRLPALRLPVRALGLGGLAGLPGVFPAEDRSRHRPIRRSNAARAVLCAGDVSARDRPVEIPA